VIAGHFVAFFRRERKTLASNPRVHSVCSMLLLRDYAYGYGYDYELWSSWSFVMSSCVACNKPPSPPAEVSKERSASEVLEGTSQLLKMKALRFFGKVQFARYTM